MLIQAARKYCSKSSIDVVPYFVNKRLQKSEKIFWFLVILISCIFGGFVIFNIAMRVTEAQIVKETSDYAVSVTKVR